MKRYVYQDIASDIHGWLIPAGVLILALAFNWPGAAAGAVGPPEAVKDVALAEGSGKKKSAGKTALAQSAEERLGVKIRGVRLSAAGFMLDLRYRVLDGAKAAPLLDGKIHPYLLASNGARFGVPFSPKVGALRSTRRGEIHLDRDYSMLFGNPGRYLQRGSKITLVVGEQKFENLVVD